MFDAKVKTWPDDVESWQTVLTDADLTVTLDTGDVDNVATQAAINFSRNVHYLLTNLTTDSARLIARQNFDSNAFETWRLLRLKIALPDATRHVPLLTQLLDFKFNPSTSESDFNT